MKIIRPAIRRALNAFNYEVVKLSRYHQSLSMPNDLQNVEIIKATADYTMTPPEAIHNLLLAVEYVVNNNILGSIVECGVWRGGSMMAVAMKMDEVGLVRNIYLYDTFAGMTEPTEHDVNANGTVAKDVMRELRKQTAASRADVEHNMRAAGSRYHHLIQGDVCETLSSGNHPDRIAILRLDTDFYESTKKELEVLYPLLSKGGVLIVDDYGGWLGARKAVDEYFQGEKLFIRCASNGGVMTVK